MRLGSEKRGSMKRSGTIKMASNKIEEDLM